VRLKYAYVIQCDKVVRDSVSGKVIELLCSYDERTKGGVTPEVTFFIDYLLYILLIVLFFDFDIGKFLYFHLLRAQNERKELSSGFQRQPL
jgi:glutaminyl-tRNA synthetase